MKLDDTPILERKAAEQQSLTKLVDLCVSIGPVIRQEFSPFEKYCGEAKWQVGGVCCAEMRLIFPYRDTKGDALLFKASLSKNFSGVVQMTAPYYPFRSINLPELTSEALAVAFIEVHGYRAEQAFDAVVRGEPWLLSRILR